MDLQNFLSFVSSRASTVDHVEVMSLRSPRKMQDEQEVMDETAVKATRGRGEDAWRLDPEGETEMPKRKASTWTCMVNVTKRKNPEGKVTRNEKKMKKLKARRERNIIRVESEETKDYVRKAKDMDQEEAEDMSFVPSAIAKADVSL